MFLSLPFIQNLPSRNGKVESIPFSQRSYLVHILDNNGIEAPRQDEANKMPKKGLILNSVHSLHDIEQNTYFIQRWLSLNLRINLCCEFLCFCAAAACPLLLLLVCVYLMDKHAHVRNSKKGTITTTTNWMSIGSIRLLSFDFRVVANFFVLIAFWSKRATSGQQTISNENRGMLAAANFH